MGLGRTIGAFIGAFASGLFMYWILSWIVNLPVFPHAPKDLPTLFAWGAGIGVFGIVMLSGMDR